MTIWKAFIGAWSSRKLWMFLLTVTVLWCGLERVINHIYALPTDKCGFLVNIAIAVFGIIGCAAGAYMGFESRFSADSVSNALNQVETMREDISQDRKYPKASAFDDGGEDLDHD